MSVETPWAKFGNCREFALVGRDAIAMVSGVYARFYDFNSGNVRVERFDGGERGDGACCLAGLSVAPIFSVAERKINPRISIFAYPTIKRIGRCAQSERAIGYLCCAFAGTEHLLGQTTFPDFRLILWHWRTGQQLAAISTPVTSAFPIDHTRIACSTDSSRFVARFSSSSGTLSIYRILSCSETVRLLPIGARSNHASVSCCWSTEGTLLCCDESATVCSIDFEKREDERLVETIIEKRDEELPLRRNPLILAHSGGTLLVRLTSATENGDARATFYRRPWNGEKWAATWTIRLPSYPRCVESDPYRDRILFLGENGDLCEIPTDRPSRLKVLLQDDARFTTVSPLCRSYFVALDRTDRLAVLDGNTGNPVSQTKPLSHHGKVVDLTSHPALPILASCSASGNCLLVQAAVPSCPKVASCVHLQREALDRVKFSDRGRVLGVAASQTGRLFLLSVGVAEAVKPIALLSAREKVVDFLIYETGTEQRGAAKALLLLGGKDASDARAGSEIAIYSCPFSAAEHLYEKADLAIELPRRFERIHHYGEQWSRDIVGIPYLAKQLYRMELKGKENFQRAQLSEALPSLHQMRGIEANRCAAALLTYGFDGLIVSRDRNQLRRVTGFFVAHHRTEGGCKRAILVDNAIVSLGRNGDLVANKLPHRIVDRERSTSTTSCQEAATETRTGTCTGETWMDEKTRQRSMAEEKRCLASRNSVLDDWEELKRRVKELLDWNETIPESSRLPLSAFDLDREARERRLETAGTMQQESLRDARERIARQDRSRRYLRQRFLDPLIDPPRTVFSFFGSCKVANYPLVKLAPRETEFLRWCGLLTETRQLVSRLEDQEVWREKKTECPWNLCRGFVDVLEACATTEHRERQWKRTFNERLEKLRSAKKREMQAAIERANETRRLLLELRQTFGMDESSGVPEVPRWHPIELIEDTFDGNADSSGESPNLRGTVAEETSDHEAGGIEDFREKMLERTMDGVLEVGLEDNAKKKIAKPDCLLRKEHPSSYTEEDVRAIRSYEEKIRARQSDRDKYRCKLESEIERIKGEFHRRVNDFDDRTKELSAEKIRVERSILSQTLFRVQAILWHRNTVRERREIEHARERELAPATKESRELAATCELFERELVELRNRYETARKQDKLLEEKFREKHKDWKGSTADRLWRQYRKRPRVSSAGCTVSVAFLLETASCAVAERISEIPLPKECVNYLRAIDQLDEKSEKLYRRVDADQWRAFCRLRRLKVEAETKVKSCAIELAEAEQSLAWLRDACSAARATVNRRKEAISGLGKRSIDPTNEQPVQLHLKTGQVEGQGGDGCPRSDWRHAVLIPREQLLGVNREIAEAERQRLLARRRLASVRRVVSHYESRHARANLKMDVLQDRVKQLDNFKVHRIVRQCCEEEQQSRGTTRTQGGNVEIRDALQAPRKMVEELIERERAKSRRIAAESGSWRGRNGKLREKMERGRKEREELLAAVRTRDSLGSSVAAFRLKEMRAIRKKAYLVRRVRDLSEQLSILENRLETSKSRTYPTLEFKF